MIQEIKSWSLSYQNESELVGTVPCSMYSILLAHGKIDDTFYRLNEYEARAMSEQDCTLTASFSAY